MTRRIRLVLLAIGLLAITPILPRANAQTYGVYREVYTNISGNSIANLTNAVSFPNSPGSTNFVTDLFESPVNVLDNYGQRMRAFVLPPTFTPASRFPNPVKPLEFTPPMAPPSMQSIFRRKLQM